jgi:alkaline phosphatase D
MPLAPYTRQYYTKLYRQVYASLSWSPLLRSIPWIHMYDDHEIINDFAPSTAECLVLQEAALGPFRSYQLAVNPPAADLAQPTYTAFNIGKVAFFVLDNRSFRDKQPFRLGSNSTAGFGRRTMLGQRQLDRLSQWAIRENEEGRLLVLVSGVPFTRNWSEGKDEVDSWGVSCVS